MYAIGSPEHALLLVKTVQNMCRRLSAPSDPDQGYWRALDYVTWNHRNRAVGRMLFESTDPRDLVHERSSETPKRLPEEQYLQLVFRLYGWNDFMSRLSITDVYARRGCSNRLTYEALDGTLHYEYRESGSDVFMPYKSAACQHRLTSLIAGKLDDLVAAFYGPVRTPNLRQRYVGA